VRKNVLIRKRGKKEKGGSTPPGKPSSKIQPKGGGCQKFTGRGKKRDTNHLLRLSYIGVNGGGGKKIR